jgi:hypothetical protein
MIASRGGRHHGQPPNVRPVRPIATVKTPEFGASVLGIAGFLFLE